MKNFLRAKRGAAGEVLWRLREKGAGYIREKALAVERGALIKSNP
jgi:hypothetical protein